MISKISKIETSKLKFFHFIHKVYKMLTINKILKYSLFLKKRDHECSEKKAIRIKKYQVFTLLKQILRIFFKKKKKKKKSIKKQ